MGETYGLVIIARLLLKNCERSLLLTHTLWFRRPPLPVHLRACLERRQRETDAQQRVITGLLAEWQARKAGVA